MDEFILTSISPFMFEKIIYWFYANYSADKNSWIIVKFFNSQSPSIKLRNICKCLNYFMKVKSTGDFL